MYQIIFSVGKSLQHEEFKTETEFLNFVNGISFQEVTNSIIVKGKKIQLVKSEKGWQINDKI